MQHPTTNHYDIVVRIDRYIKNTSCNGHFLSSVSPIHIKAFTDSEGTTYQVSHYSTTYFSIFMGSSLLSWKSKKQSNVPCSSLEVEYKALASTTSEIQ